MAPIWIFAIAAGLAILFVGGLALVARQMAAGQRDVASLRDRILEYGAVQDRIHTVVRERLDEVGQKVGDGLQRSDRTIGEIRERLAVIDQAQKNITELSRGVVGLQDILSNKQARGAFGEVQLQDLVKSALPPSAYAFQHTLSNGKRADCLILMPNPPGPIVVDAKFPLESYRELRAAKDEPARVAAARKFGRDVLTHVNDIAEKYIVRGETAESAILFLPSEAVFAELHAAFTNVVEDSYRKRVYIVSPATLWATLNTIRAILRDVRMQEQAAMIREEVLELLGDVRRLDERMAKMASHFDQTGEQIRQARISADKIVRRGERIRDSDLSAQVEAAPTEPVAPPAPSLFARD